MFALLDGASSVEDVNGGAKMYQGLGGSLSV